MHTETQTHLRCLAALPPIRQAVPLKNPELD